MGMSVGSKKKGGMDEINVTPLIDVVLVLLIIFMVLTPITVQKMASNLPPIDPPPKPDVPPPEQLMVAVYKDGTTALNMKMETDDELQKDVTNRLNGRASEDRIVFIDADPDSIYGRVVSVMDLVRVCGATHVGFADMKDEGPAKMPDGMTAPDPAAPAAPAAPG